MNEQLLLDLIKKIYCRAELKQKGEWQSYSPGFVCEKVGGNLCQL
jgi:hypothetical protein